MAQARATTPEAVLDAAAQVFLEKGYRNWLHTDDLAVLDEDGYITLVDRRKDMIISGGFNVYPSEVESAIGELPGVGACAVIGVPDAKWGEAVKAFVVRESGAELTADQIMAHVRQRKGPVNAPKAVEFVDALPLTAVGKLDKKALRVREAAVPPARPSA